MILDFDAIGEQVIPHFKGGEKEFKSHMYTDEACKIMRASLEPGATIGLHTHETNSEIIFMLEGTGVVLYDDGREILPAGSCHYCPKGHSHSLRNESDETIVFYAVVPEQ
ncbi:MAG: cupin domain-containing protein [bacterium]|nr:cupin domain-containing protein [bacterium]MCM1423670.1 cupin domain-containing protein [bacterium]